LDFALIVVIVSALVGIAALGPSNTYANAQAWNAGEGLGILERGDWLLPRDQLGRVPRKPPLLAWAEAAILSVTTARNDLVYRLPTILAGIATVVLVYLLGRRWFDRRTGLLAAGLWIVGLHMSKLLYFVTTDMLLTLWITSSIFCADRLLQGPRQASGRGGWAVGLWASMILAALSKGWGVVNIPVVGGYVAMVSAIEPGFGELAALGPRGRLAGEARLVLRRWREAISRVNLGWGMLAMLAVLGALLAGQLIRGGQEMRDAVYYEFWQRGTGAGDAPPNSSQGPRLLYMIYYALPGSVFAIGAIIMGLRRMVRPLCWVAAVAVPFSIPHGFRADYFLPAYAAVALMGGWAAEELVRRGPNRDRAGNAVRHMLAAAPVVIGLVLTCASLAYLFRGEMPQSWHRLLPMPAWTLSPTWHVLAGLGAIGAATLALAVFTSLTWRIRAMTWLTIVSMLGVHYFVRHIISRSAVHPDGEVVRTFSIKARSVMGKDSFAMAGGVGLLGCELYIGRFGLFDPNGQPFVNAGQISRSGATWVIVADHGLVDLGLAEARPGGTYESREGGRYLTVPQNLGEVALTSAPVYEGHWGRIYLIRLQRPPRPEGQASRPARQPDE